MPQLKSKVHLLQNSFLLSGGQSLFFWGLQLIGCRQPTSWRVIYFAQNSPLSMLISFNKYPHRNIRSKIWPTIKARGTWLGWHTELTIISPSYLLYTVLPYHVSCLLHMDGKEAISTVAEFILFTIASSESELMSDAL